MSPHRERRATVQPVGVGTVFHNVDDDPTTAIYTDFSDCEGCPECGEGSAEWVEEGLYNHEPGPAGCRVAQFWDAWPKEGPNA